MSAIRVAAAADIHLAAGSGREWHSRFADVATRADLLLLGGDLTQRGLAAEGRAVAEALRAIAIPVVAVLGNHDYHQGADQEIRRMLEGAGVRVLERDATTVQVDGRTVGIAGTKGFCGGFGMSAGNEFGEPEMKSFVHAAKVAAHALYDTLRAMTCDIRIALMHYAPTRETLAGERPEIEPFLGSYLLGEALDGAGCDLAIHGHAHHGAERGFTPGGIAVRNVAVPVIRAAYRVLELP